MVGIIEGGELRRDMGRMLCVRNKIDEQMQKQGHPTTSSRARETSCLGTDESV
jgi:hypothetical protein